MCGFCSLHHLVSCIQILFVVPALYTFYNIVMIQTTIFSLGPFLGGHCSVWSTVVQMSLDMTPSKGTWSLYCTVKIYWSLLMSWHSHGHPGNLEPTIAESVPTAPHESTPCIWKLNRTRHTRLNTQLIAPNQHHGSHCAVSVKLLCLNGNQNTTLNIPGCGSSSSIFATLNMWYVYWAHNVHQLPSPGKYSLTIWWGK